MRVEGMQTVLSAHDDCMTEILFTVGSYPTAKSEAKSMLAAGHLHSDRVHRLLEAAAAAVATTQSWTLQEEVSLGMELAPQSPVPPPTRW